MIPKELEIRLRDQLLSVWRNSLMYGPIKYGPPTHEQCEKLGFTHEEGLALYDQTLRGWLVEVSPGLWDTKGHAAERQNHPPKKL